MKKLVIIHGVTGAIGSACLSLFGSQKDTVVYGISRKAKDFREFCVGGKLPAKTLICSISGDTLDDHYPARMSYQLGKAIDPELFEGIYYIHALGVYPFEIDDAGNRTVSFDNDMDGIDDRCTELTHYMFSSFYSGIASVTRKHVHSFIFGGIADKHEPFAHTSWWKTMKELKTTLVETFEKSEQGSVIKNLCKVSVINISSVLCPNELISRPFVFTNTDGDPEYWLTPLEVASLLQNIITLGQQEDFREYELFKVKPKFDPEYYEDKKFTPRKITELYRK